MPKQSKSKSEVLETTNAVAPSVVEQNVTEKLSKPKAQKSKPAKTTESVVPTLDSVGPTTVVDVPALESGALESSDVADLAVQSTEFLAKLNQVGTLLASLKTEFRSLEKKWSRELKTAQKSQAKRKRKSGNRQPSGFVKPTKISDELAKFLEKPLGSEMARTDVTREINSYIRAHKLQDKDNGRKINPDSKLATLLKVKKTDELTYFNLQRYMSPHFPKVEKVVTV
jgi:upstream activation factor subunit UAF30